MGFTYAKIYIVRNMKDFDNLVRMKTIPQSPSWILVCSSILETPIELNSDKKTIFLNGNVLLVRTWTIILYGWLVIERTKKLNFGSNFAEKKTRELKVSVIRRWL